MVGPAVEALAGSGIPVAAVSTGFPAGLTPSEAAARGDPTRSVEGAREIDIVITRAHVLTGDWSALYDEVARSAKPAAPRNEDDPRHGRTRHAAQRRTRPSMVCMMAGADFIKTSTGKEGVNATLPVALVMVRMIARLSRARPASTSASSRRAASRTAKDALDWLSPDEGGARACRGCSRICSASARAACSPTSSGSSSIS